MRETRAESFARLFEAAHEGVYIGLLGPTTTRTLAANPHLKLIFGHAGDGNLHVNPLVNVRKSGWVEEIEAVLHDVAELVARLGGTLAGEHGDGRLRAPLLERIWGSETTMLFRAVKRIFDPQGLLNPGVILPLPGQRPLESIRPYP